MFVRQDFAIYYIFLLDIQCATFCIENRSVKKANSHFTICSFIDSYSYNFLKTDGLVFLFEPESYSFYWEE